MNSKKDRIIVVSGLTRCGSSLMMQMLHAGGHPISCEPGNEAISGERESQIETLRTIALGLADGKAIKSLDPLNFPLPPDRNYEFIWMERDFVEQAKSIAKFTTLMLGVPSGRAYVRKIAKSLPGETDRSIRYLLKLGTVHRFRFEDCIQDVGMVLYRLQSIIPTLNTSHMKSVVINRDVKCYNGMLEIELLKRVQEHPEPK